MKFISERWKGLLLTFIIGGGTWFVVIHSLTGNQQINAPFNYPSKLFFSILMLVFDVIGKGITYLLGDLGGWWYILSPVLFILTCAILLILLLFLVKKLVVRYLKNSVSSDFILGFSFLWFAVLTIGEIIFNHVKCWSGC